MLQDMELNERQLQIKTQILRLDQIAIDYEARWGAGNLFEYAGDDFIAKWQAQQGKLHDAIKRQDMDMVQELVEGCIRGLAEAGEIALQGGFKPQDPDYWDVKLKSGFHLRVAKNHTQARAVTEDGVVVWSLEEIARVIEKDYTDLAALKEITGAQIVDITPRQDIDWLEGDALPPEF